MAAPAWATNLTTFWLEGATTVTSIGTGSPALGNPETDFFIQGTDCISKAAWVNAIKGFIVDALGTTFTVPTSGAIVMWAKYDAQGSLDSQTNGGLQMIVGSSSSAYDHFYIAGKDTIQLSSWVPYVIDPNTATADTTTSTPDGSERWVGILGNLPTTSGPTKGNPIAIDAVRYGRCDVEYTAGDITLGYNTFSGAEGYGNDATRRWGLIELQDGAYQIQGFHSFGTSGTAVDFRDSNKVLFFRKQLNNLTDDAVAAAFNRVEVIHASSNVDWTNIIIQALGSRSLGTFVHTAGTWDCILCQFVDVGTFSLLSTSVFNECTFRNTGIITAPGSNLQDSLVTGFEGTANTSPVIWDVATDPITNLSGMTFEKGTADTHAIEFGTTAPLSMTFTDMTFTGYNTTTDDQNDSTIHIKRTSGTVTISIVGTGTPAASMTARSDGATVNFEQNVAVTFDGMKDNTEVRVYTAGTSTELQGIENATAGTTDDRSFIATVAAATSVDYVLHSEAYETIRVNAFTWPSTAQTINVQQRADRNYENP